MKKLAVLAIGLTLVGIWAFASPSTGTWDGWISDSRCGAKGANASHADCAKGCIGSGEKPVLVTDKDQKIVPIENPAAVTGHAGQHVKVTGSMTANGTVHIDKVAALGN